MCLRSDLASSRLRDSTDEGRPVLSTNARRSLDRRSSDKSLTRCRIKSFFEVSGRAKSVERFNDLKDESRRSSGLTFARRSERLTLSRRPSARSRRSILERDLRCWSRLESRTIVTCVVRSRDRFVLLLISRRLLDLSEARSSVNRELNDRESRYSGLDRRLARLCPLVRKFDSRVRREKSFRTALSCLSKASVLLKSGRYCSLDLETRSTLRDRDPRRSADVREIVESLVSGVVLEIMLRSCSRSRQDDIPVRGLKFGQASTLRSEVCTFSESSLNCRANSNAKPLPVRGPMFQFRSRQTSCTALLVSGDKAYRQAGKGHHQEADVLPSPYRQRNVPRAPHL